MNTKTRAVRSGDEASQAQADGAMADMPITDRFDPKRTSRRPAVIAGYDSRGKERPIRERWLKDWER